MMLCVVQVLVLEAEAVVVFLDARYKAVRIPDEVKRAFGQMAERRESAKAAC
jgi:hypothetical protein